MFTNVNRFWGFWYSRSNSAWEIETSPYGEPPLGGLVMPISFRCRNWPVGVSTDSGEPTLQVLGLRVGLVDERAVCSELRRDPRAARLPLDVDHLADVRGNAA